MTKPMKPKTLAQLKEYCAEYHVEVEHDNNEILLNTEKGYQFEPHLHSLVTSLWDDETNAQMLKNAIEDALTYCPGVEPCPEDCSCNEKLDEFIINAIRGT